MPLTISVLDEATNGVRVSAGPLQFDTDAITLRDLIRIRIEQDVARFNESATEPFRGLIQPEESERVLNGTRRRAELDSQKQFDKAIRSFNGNGNGFLVLVDNCQITDLDHTIHLKPESQVTFLKLVPLIGG